MNRSTPLIAIGAVAAGALVALTLGASFEVIPVVALAIPIALAWWKLCGKLEAHEPELDAMLDERAATLKTTFAAMAGKPAKPARQAKAYTGKTHRLDEVER